ncbi:MAG: hypothetical protein JRN06_10910 [Nitrososphaerota archaeon]|nr:hypothetical protein [Nitrososphaerota archaeon]
MTSFRGRVAGGLTVLEAVWALYSYFGVGPNSCPLGGCPGPQLSPLYGDATIILAVIVLIDGAVGLWGAGLAYTAGAVLSAALLALTAYATWVDLGYPYLSGEVEGGVVGCSVALLALAGNILASRSQSGLSEQANPMNLPVFG